MAIKLREGESVKAEAHFHWTAFLFAKFLALCGFLVLAGSINGAVANRTEEGATFMLFAGFSWAIALCLPLAYKWLQNKFKKYLVTNQRIYIEVGVLSRSKSDLPLNKINDVSLQQGMFQRLFGSGNIVILTGNDTPTIISDIDQPDDFKNAISEMIERRKD